MGEERGEIEEGKRSGCGVSGRKRRKGRGKEERQIDRVDREGGGERRDGEVKWSGRSGDRARNRAGV